MPTSAAVRPTPLAFAAIGISARQSSSRTGASVSLRESSGAVSHSTTHPAKATGMATLAKENIDRLTPSGLAIPAISRLELVPIRVADPARVVACAVGSSTPRAGTPLVCSSSLVAGMSIAMIGVVLISAESTPTGGISRTSAPRTELTPASRRNITRDTTPV